MSSSYTFNQLFTQRLLVQPFQFKTVQEEGPIPGLEGNTSDSCHFEPVEKSMHDESINAQLEHRSLDRLGMTRGKRHGFLKRHFMISMVCVLIFSFGCDSNDPDEEMVDPTSVAGQWEGVVTSNGVEFPVQMEITEDMTVLTGTGSVELESGTVTFTVDPTSSYIHPLVNMFLFFERPPLGTLNGVVSTDRQQINGTMSGPGFSGAAELSMSRM